MNKKKDPGWAGSFKSYPKREGRPFSPAEALADSTVSEWYSEKHRRLTAEEAAMVNAARAGRCAHCGSADVVRDGKRGDGVQKYLCGSCGKRFNPPGQHRRSISNYVYST